MRIDVKIRGTDMAVPVRMNGVVTVPTESDHAKLANRDAPDQHPIEAISGLTQELSDRPEGQAITNAEIDQIWKTIIGG